MYVLVTNRDEKKQMKNEGARVGLYFRCSWAANSVAGGWVWQKIKLIQTPCYLQMRKIHSKMKVLKRSQQISHCKSMQIFMMLKGS